jgi:hypothetical protein
MMSDITHPTQNYNITHVLTVTNNRDGSCDIGKKIQEEVYHKINNVPIQHIYNGMNIIITWRSNKTSPTDCYHTDVMGLLGDTAVHRHTEMLLAGLLPQLNEKFAKDCAGLSFTVTKPLSRSYALIPADI